MSKFQDLIIAIKNKNIKKGLELINSLSTVELKEKDERGNTALHKAAMFKAIPLLRPLLDKMDEETVSACNTSNYTALHLLIKFSLIRGEDRDLFEQFLIKMNDLGLLARETSEGKTILHKAASLNFIKTCEVLINKCPQLVTIKNNNGFTTLDYLAKTSNNYEVAKKLIEYGADFNTDLISKYSHIFQSWAKEIIKADMLLSKEDSSLKEINKIEAHNNLKETLVNRISFKLQEKLNDLSKDEIYKKYIIFTENLKLRFPDDFTNKTIEKINKIEIGNMKLLELVNSLNQDEEFKLANYEVKLMNLSKEDINPTPDEDKILSESDIGEELSTLGQTTPYWIDQL